MKNKTVKLKKSKGLTKEERITLLNESFDNPPPGITSNVEKKTSGSKLDPRVMTIATSYWSRCPIKSHLDGSCRLVSVPFESKCPKSLVCYVVPILEESPRTMTSKDDMLDAWTLEDIKAYNKSIDVPAKPKAIGAPSPLVKLNTVCSACTLGGTTGLDSEQKKSTGVRPEMVKVKLPRRKK